jgi:hypothetical protein
VPLIGRPPCCAGERSQFSIPPSRFELLDATSLPWQAGAPWKTRTWVRDAHGGALAVRCMAVTVDMGHLVYKVAVVNPRFLLSA